jgi:hypothetical protein
MSGMATANVGGTCYNLTNNKEKEIMSNINKSNEIVLAIAKSVKEETNYNASQALDLAYAKAFGFAWGILNDDQRELMVEYYLGTEKLLNL